MIPRILEPEVMDTREEARDYDSMDHSKVNRVFVQDFLSVWDRRSPILDVGTGTAQIPIELCRQAAEATVIGIDLSAEMLVVGNENVQRATLTDRIKCELVNARGLPYAGGSFPAVISNSIIHHIPEPIDCIREMVRVCAPGGVIFVRDLLRPLDELNLRQLVNTYAGDANAHQKKMFADSLHAALDLSEIRDLVAQFGFPTNSVQATSDRHWTWSARKG